MDLTVGVLIMLVPPLITVEGLFSGAEIALLSSDKLALKRLAKQGNRGAKLALSLANHPEQIFSTTLLMTNICAIGSSALIALYFLGHAWRFADLIAIAITAPLVMICGEFIPKSIYQRKATQFAPWVSFPVKWMYWICFPITFILSSYTTKLSRLIGPIEELLAGRKRTTRDELRSLLTYTKRETEIKASERRMIKRILDFRDSEAKNALLPLVSVEAIEDVSTIKEALEKFEQHRHSRMPVYSERVDNIIGIIEVSDLFAATDLNHTIRHYIAPAHYVAETHALDELLLEMRREGTEMAIVVDEHGGAVGILTLEDIVEEIVGEISDEYDSEALPYRELSAASWLVQAKMEIQEINETLKLELPFGEYKTLSGFLLQQFSRIPEAHDELFFNTPSGTLKFTIRKATERHIESVLIETIAPAKD